MSELDNEQRMYGLCYQCIDRLELSPRFDLEDWQPGLACSHCGDREYWTYRPKSKAINKMDDALKQHSRLVDKLDAAMSKWSSIRHSASQFSIDWKAGALSDLSFAAWRLMKFLNDGASYICAECAPMPLEEGMFFRSRKCDKCGKQTMCYEHKIDKEKSSKQRTKLYICEKCDTCADKKDCWFCFNCKCDKCGRKGFCATHKIEEARAIEPKKPEPTNNIIEQ